MFILFRFKMNRCSYVFSAAADGICVIINTVELLEGPLDINIYERMTMRRFAVLIMVLLFAGCSSPSLFEKNGDLIGLQLKGETVSVEAEKIKEDRISLNNLSIKRTLYSLENGSHVVFELAVTQPPYQFSYDVKQSLRYIFDANKVVQIDRVGNLGFYAIELGADRQVLAIAQNMNKKGIKMVYGLSKHQLKSALKKTEGESSVDIDALRGVQALGADESAFLTKWLPKLIILDGLIYRPGGKPAMM